MTFYLNYVNMREGSIFVDVFMFFYENAQNKFIIKKELRRHGKKDLGN